MPSEDPVVVCSAACEVSHAALASQVQQGAPTDLKTAVEYLTRLDRYMKLALPSKGQTLDKGNMPMAVLRHKARTEVRALDHHLASRFSSRIRAFRSASFLFACASSGEGVPQSGACAVALANQLPAAAG